MRSGKLLECSSANQLTVPADFADVVVPFTPTVPDPKLQAKP